MSDDNCNTCNKDMDDDIITTKITTTTTTSTTWDRNNAGAIKTNILLE